jgi:hypothetical protein
MDAASTCGATANSRVGQLEISPACVHVSSVYSPHEPTTGLARLLVYNASAVYECCSIVAFFPPDRLRCDPDDALRKFS